MVFAASDCLRIPTKHVSLPLLALRIIDYAKEIYDQLASRHTNSIKCFY